MKSMYNFHILVLMRRAPRHTQSEMRDGRMPTGERTRTTAVMESCAGTRHAHGKASSSVMMQLVYRVPSLLAPSCAAAGLAAALLASFLAALDIFV